MNVGAETTESVKTKRTRVRDIKTITGIAERAGYTHLSILYERLAC